jgi:hypothetical protein
MMQSVRNLLETKTNNHRGRATLNQRGKLTFMSAMPKRSLLSGRPLNVMASTGQQLSVGYTTVATASV